MLLAPGTRLGPYEILGPLGVGGMGEVYRARDTRLDRTVAIKILPDHLSKNAEARARFEREARTVSSLSHPHICTLHDVGSQDGIDFLVMEHLEGETLLSRLQKGPLDLGLALRTAIQIADALDRAHRAGIVHRDLKPGNVMMTKSGAKLLDFGLAKGMGMSAPSNLSAALTVTSPLTEQGTIVGTLQYMAPEQLERKDADARSDIFAFGAILYEMVTGRRAFKGKTHASLIASILKDEPRPFADLAPVAPPSLERLVRQCLAKDRDERRQSLHDVRLELEGIAGAAAQMETVQQSLRERRFVGPVATAAALVLALIAGATGFMAGRRTSGPATFAGITFHTMNFEPEAIFTARFMPDGKTIVLSAALTGNRTQLLAIRPEYPEPERISAIDTHLLDISKRGELAVLTGARYSAFRLFIGTLARMPLGGAAPREILEGVREAAWAPDGENLTIIRFVDGEDRLEYPIGTVLRRTGGYLSDPRISVDGERVAFLEHPTRGDDRGWVSVVDRAGNTKQLTKLFQAEEGLAWSRDGREVLFSAGHDTLDIQGVSLEGHLRVALASAGGLTLQDIAPDGRWLATRDDARSQVRGVGDGGETERDFSFPGLCWGAILSRDGRSILFSDGNPGSGTNYAVNFRKTDGSPVIRLGEGSATDLSSDGKWVLAIIGSQPPRLVAYPTGPGQAIQFDRGTLAGYQKATWFSDSKRVLVCGHEVGRPGRCWVQRVEGGAMTVVTPEGVGRAAVSPDGRLVAGWGGTTPALYPVEGGEPRPLPFVSPDDEIVRFSPDGKALFATHGSLPVVVDRIELTTGRRERIREIGRQDQVGLTGIAGVSLADDPRYYAYVHGSHLSTLFIVEGAR